MVRKRETKEAHTDPKSGLSRRDFVKAGEVVAIVGNTGELTTGPHLHFELWYNGTAVNPLDYIAF